MAGPDKEKTSNSEFRSNLLALVSHELNTPLTGIINAISVLESRYADDKEFLPMLRRNAERLQKTVDNMLDLAEADAGILRVHLTEAALENILHREMEKLRPRVERDGFRYETDFESDLPTVCADPMRLGRVIDTFIENAVKFSQKQRDHTNPPFVRIALEMLRIEDLAEKINSRDLSAKTGLFLVVSVASSQPPLGEMPQSYEEFFEPFSPWKDIYTREKDGLGIELALAREVLLAHHGFIAAGPADPAGKGCTFYFGLPVLSRQDELEFVIDNRIHGAMGNLTKTSILVLRFDPELQEKTANMRRIEEEVRNLMYRSSDSVFSNPSSGEITIVMDDCNARGAEKLAQRLAKDLSLKIPNTKFVFGTATGPDDGATAKELINRVAHNWQPLA